MSSSSDRLRVCLVLSIFGITLIPLTLIGGGGAFFVGYVAVAQVLGRRLLVAARRPDQPIILEVLVGLLVVTAIGYIPGWAGCLPPPPH